MHFLAEPKFPRICKYSSYFVLLFGASYLLANLAAFSCKKYVSSRSFFCPSGYQDKNNI
ncbi:unnamed protein product [Phyllotreta striolata]|uniref:Uncharacterized protein n=1 Tax=Phyllotreta striolata TaxID=444603 RepID=A0A9N9TJP8_PHYSR|nr:unnamed protein product [Phyllotreta striolata]